MEDCKSIEIFVSNGGDRLLSVAGDFGLFRELLKSLVDSNNENDFAKLKRKAQELCNVESEVPERDDEADTV